MITKTLPTTLLLFALSAHSQAIGQIEKIRVFSEEEIAAVVMPVLEFDARRARSEDFEKYFYFHRVNTTFAQAFADISECDDLSNGRAFYNWSYDPFLGPLGSLMVDAIYGSSERRAIRRINMRNCMGFKGYNRFGITKKLWEKFNFEEGSRRKEEGLRETALLQQARVASGPKPKTRALAR